MPRRRITLIAIAAAFVALVLTIVLTSCMAPEPETESTDPPEGAPVAVFIGDSFTVGTASDIAGFGFPGILGELRGWEVVNLGIPGTGYSTPWDPYADRIQQAVALDPDIVVVSGSRNDMRRASVDEIEPHVTDFYEQLAEAIPDARVIVTSPIGDDAPYPPIMHELRDMIERQAAQAGVEYLDLGHPLEGRPELVASDGQHPNADGLQVIAERIDELLE